VKASAPVTGRRTRTVRAVRGAHPGCFALVMSTGIVSAALRQAGSPRSSAVLLAIAAGSFSALAVASAWRAAAFPADLRGDLACPGHGVYLVAACDVPGTGSPADGQYAAALAAAGLLAQLGLTCLVPGRPAAWPRALPAITAITAAGTCGAVGTRGQCPPRQRL
jgi:hypothetical protein